MLVTTMFDTGCNFEFYGTEKKMFIGKELPAGEQVDPKYCDFGSKDYGPTKSFYKDTDSSMSSYYPTNAWEEVQQSEHAAVAHSMRP